MSTPRSPLTPDLGPGETPERPLFMRLITDGERVHWGNVAVMLAVTVLSGYLAARSQQWGSGPDVGTLAKMRAAQLGQRAGNAITAAGVRLSIVSARAYDQARPV